MLVQKSVWHGARLSLLWEQVRKTTKIFWATSTDNLCIGILALTVPELIHAIGQPALLGLFAGLDAIALLLVWLFVPGTERQIITMEEMNYVFGVKLGQHVQYQIHEVAPWCYNHYVLRQEQDDLPPLYRYARSLNVTNGT